MSAAKYPEPIAIEISDDSDAEGKEEVDAPLLSRRLTRSTTQDDTVKLSSVTQPRDRVSAQPFCAVPNPDGPLSVWKLEVSGNEKRPMPDEEVQTFLNSHLWNPKGFDHKTRGLTVDDISHRDFRPVCFSFSLSFIFSLTSFPRLPGYVRTTRVIPCGSTSSACPIAEALGVRTVSENTPKNVLTFTCLTPSFPMPR